MADQIVASFVGRADQVGGRRAWSAAAVGSRLFSTSAFLLSGRLFGAAAGFLVQLVLARALSPDDLGAYFTATSLVIVGGVVAAHGYPSLAARFVSRYRGARGATFLRAFVRRAQLETAILALLITAAIMAAALAGIGGDTGAAVAVAALMVPFVAGFRLYGSLATATRRFALAYLPDVSLKPVATLAALGLVAFAAGGITLIQAMLCMAAATAVLATIQFVLLARRFPVKLRLRRVASRGADRKLAARWRREAHATLPVAVFSQFLADLGILAATPFLDAAEMGAFGICVKLAFIVGFFVMLTQNIATPDIADAIGRRGDGSGHSKITASAGIATAVTLLAVLATALVGGFVLRLFGAEFAAAYPALLILVAAQLARAVFGPANAVLTLVAERRANLIATSVGGIFLIVSMPVLASAFRLEGAALSVLLTMILWSGAGAWLLHRRTGLRVDVLAALRG